MQEITSPIYSVGVAALLNETCFPFSRIFKDQCGGGVSKCTAFRNGSGGKWKRERREGGKEGRGREGGKRDMPKRRIRVNSWLLLVVCSAAGCCWLLLLAAAGCCWLLLLLLLMTVRRSSYGHDRASGAANVSRAVERGGNRSGGGRGEGRGGGEAERVRVRVRRKVRTKGRPWTRPQMVERI